MRILSNRRIKSKIIILLFLVGALSVITGSIFNYFYGIHKSKDQIITNTILQAKLMSEYCGLPMEFNFPDNAADALAKLRSIPNVYDGVLFTLNDSIYASYHKTDDQINVIPPKLSNKSFIIDGDFIIVNQQVIYKGKRYGTLILRSFIDWKAIAQQHLINSIFIILIVLVVIFMLANLLHRSISEPIVHLTQKMNFVAKNKDYSMHFSESSKDEIGELYAGFNYMLDEIKTRELAINMEKERAETYLNIAEVILVAFNKKAEITLLNRKGYQILGYKQGELEGKDWFKVCLPSDEYEAVFNVFKKSIAGMSNHFEYYENHILTKKGDKRLIAWHNTFVKDNEGNIIGTLSSGEDITLRKQSELLLWEKNIEIQTQNEDYKKMNEELLKAKEHAEESDRLKTAFLQNMSHEIRTPMNAIMGFSSLLADEDDKSNIANYSDIIVQNSEQLVHIIDDIVLYSRLQTGLLSLQPLQFNISNLLSDVKQSFDLPDYWNGVKLDIDTIYAETITIFSDYEKIRQVFTNLVSNAFKYTPVGSISIGFIYTNNEFVFHVKDTGIGIPSNELDKVFERFYRASNVNKITIGGTGLGLSIVEELVSILGGKIWVENVIDEQNQVCGSVFYFSVPDKKESIL